MTTLPDNDYEEFEAWVEQGLNRKWISDLVCQTHESIPCTPEEDAQWDEGHDPCVPVVRVWGPREQ